MAYDNTNRGALFKNTRKTTENHPDYTGSLDVGGTQFYIDAWLKKSKEGKPFMSLSVKPKESRGAGGRAASNQQPDDDAPPF